MSDIETDDNGNV